MQALHGDKSRAHVFSIHASDEALARATLTDPIGTGRPWWLLTSTRSAPLALIALHDQPNLFRDSCVVTVRLFHVCWKKNTYSEARIIIFFLAID